MGYLSIDLDLLSAAERRDLRQRAPARRLERVLQETRIALLDLIVEVDDTDPRRAGVTQKSGSGADQSSARRA
jgi:hypothetical protein